jgi:hypothetical protein
VTSAGGSSSFKIADAYVLVGANLDERSVEQTVTSAQRQISRSALNLKVTLDKRSLNDAVTTTRASVKELGTDLKVKLGINLDDKSLADTALAVEAAADTMSRTSGVNLHVGLDNTSVLRAGADLKAVTRVMGTQDAINLRVNSSGLSEADNEVQSFSNRWTRLAKLITAGALIGAGPLEAVGLATVIAGFGALAIAAEASNKDVKASFKDMTASAKQTAAEGFSPVIPQLVSLGEQAKTTISGLEPAFQRAGLAISPILGTIGTDLLESVQRGVEGAEPQLNKLPPLASSIGNSFNTLEHGVGGFVNNIDVSKAVHGWDTLTVAVGQLLPALSILLNTAEPVGSALLQIVGGAVSTLFREIGELNPEMQAAGAIFSFIGPAISVVGPPLLAVAAGTRLLTGSWTDFAGAGTKLKGIVTGMPGIIEQLGQKFGYTTAAANQAAKASAEVALNTALESKAVDEAVVAEAADAVAQEDSAKNAQSLSIAKKQLAASTVEATEAQKAFDATTEESTFAMGPLGLALGVVTAGLLLFSGRSKDASEPTQDLTADLERLAAAAPGATQGILAGDPALQKLITGAKNAGVNVQGLLSAYQGGTGPLDAFTKQLQNQQKQLGDTQVSMSSVTTGIKLGNDPAVKFSASIAQLAAAGKQLSENNVKLSPQQQAQIAQYRNLQAVTAQLGVSQKALAGNQAAGAAVTQTTQQTQTQWNHTMTEASSITSAYGGNLTSTALQMQNFAAQQKNGQFSMEDFVKAQVTAAGGFLQAQAQQQQLNAAVTQTAQAQVQAGQSVASAKNQEQQAILQVADAEHSAAQSAGAVTDAEHSYQQSIQAVSDAKTAVVKAQQQEHTAQLQYTQDLAAARAAELALSAARKQAVLDLQAEQRQVLDQGDTVAQAELQLFDAQQAVNNAGLANSTLKLSDLANTKNLNTANEQSYQLLLSLSEAQHGLNDAKAQQAQVDSQNAADQKKGVSGSQDVLTAQQNIAQAQNQVQQSQQQLVDSKDSVVKASQSVVQAQYAEKQAHDAVAQAQYAEQQANVAVTQASFASQQATQALASANLQAQQASIAHKTAVQQASGSIDINTQAGNRNVTTLLQLYDNQIAAGKSTDQARTAVEKEGVQLGITKGDVDKVLGSIKNIQGKTATFGVVGTPSVNLSELINAASKQGLNPRTLGFTTSEIGNARASGSGSFPTHGAATGGLIKGPGTSTSDSIMGVSRAGVPTAWVSPDEYVVNAKATSMFLPQLEALNAAGLPGRASGGLAGDGKAIVSANLMLTEVGAMMHSAREAFLKSGIASSLPDFAPKNPPEPDFSALGAGGDTGSHGAAQAAAQAYAASVLSAHGWSSAQMAPLIKLWNQESGWQWWALNSSSGAYGIPQSLPASKMASAGPDWRTNARTQINWGLGYIQDRYGSPAAAWAHEIGYNWYDEGGVLPKGLSMSLNQTGANEHKAVFSTAQWNALGALASAVQSGTSGKTVQIHNHFLVESMSVANAVAAQASAQTSWDLATSLGA